MPVPSSSSKSTLALPSDSVPCRGVLVVASSVCSSTELLQPSMRVSAAKPTSPQQPAHPKKPTSPNNHKQQATTPHTTPHPPNKPPPPIHNNPNITTKTRPETTHTHNKLDTSLWEALASPRARNNTPTTNQKTLKPEVKEFL